MEGEKKMKTREEEVQVEIGLLHRRATDAQRTHEKMLGITSHQENQVGHKKNMKLDHSRIPYPKSNPKCIKDLHRTGEAKEVS